MSDEPQTYLLIDGENLDMTLGQRILRERPRPEQRPRWERVLEAVRVRFGGPVRALFFLNASNGLPTGFIAALQAMDFVPVPLSGAATDKVVDIAILRTLDALVLREGTVVLGSHDSDFAEGVAPLVHGGRRVAVLGFPEFMSGELRDLDGIEVVDLEHDADGFDFLLPRIRVIPIDEFDPEAFLG